VNLIVEPDDGIAPVLAAIDGAQTSLDVGIFRLDRSDVARSLRMAAARGVPVRTLIAHTNRGGDRQLRQLEQDLLKTGASVRRTDDDLRRYHSKVLIVDRTSLYVLGFNYTALDVNKSRSFGVVTQRPELVEEALRLFEADSLRQPFEASPEGLLVSPVNARARLAAFLRGAQTELLIYDPRLTDPTMIQILRERVAAGVRLRIVGRLGKHGVGLSAEKYPGIRLHVRAIVRDGQQAFVGSQGLRALELDGRREVGLIVDEPEVVARISAIFETDWSQTAQAQRDIENSAVAEGPVAPALPATPAD
jgi:phosphatidylserine/phosphatidylglycerophosphate/cardiolipin synthase-like enzyme